MPINGEIPYTRTGKDEMLNRVNNCLKALKGRYIYDRQLGSNINSVDTSAEDIIQQLIAKAREALEFVPEAEVTGATYIGGIIAIQVAAGGENYDITIGGILSE